MGKVNKKLKHMDKLSEEKRRLAKREQLLSELKVHAVDQKTIVKLKSVVTSNKKAKKYVVN
jgi:trehalose-6-phosphatase